MGPSNRTIIGVAVLIFGAILLGVGIHHLIATGTCSSTGYAANYGPVPTCPAGTGWWMGFLFAGIIFGLVGAGLAASLGLVFVGIFGGIGFGSLSLVLNSNVGSGTQVFAGIFGAGFAIPAVITGFFALNSGLESLSKSSSKGAAARPAIVLGGARSGPQRTKVVSNAFTASSSPGSSAASSSADADPLDQIAKLAELHKRGALTDDEFAHEKAKLLAE